MKIAIVQLRPRKGDRARNLRAFADAARRCADDPPDLVVLPEAAFTGYFLEGAVYEHARAASAFAEELAALWRDAAGAAPVELVCGFYENDGGAYRNAAIHLGIDAAAVVVRHVHRKVFLPTYGVFDEARFVSRGDRFAAYATPFGRAAILLCEDAWHAIAPTLAALDGARLLIVPSASPGRGLAGAGGELENVARWRELLRLAASEHGVFVVYAGLTGFEGGKGMTGSSCVVDPFGVVLATAPALEEAILRVEIDLGEVDLARAQLPLLGDLRAVLPDLLASGAFGRRAGDGA